MGTSSEMPDTPPSLIPTASELDDGLARLAEAIRAHDQFLVVAHEEPDGDAMGSTLAMADMLRKAGKDVTAYNRDGVPYICDFLAGSEAVVTELPEDASFDVTIMLDCAAPERLGEDFPEAGWGDTVAVVDHHKTWDSEFADIYVRDAKASATGEILYRLVQHLEITLDRQLAECLYCAVMTDTGGFRYSNTSRTTFRIAGELLEAGVDPWEMTCQLYESEPLRRVELLSEVLQTLRLSSCGRLAFLRIESDMLEDSESASELTDGFINYGRSIRGVEVSTQLREREDGRWKVSFRSKGEVDVSLLAQRFGGGGHHNAAACVIDAEPETIEEELTEALVDILS